jgi:hypothetical protein
MFRAGALCIRHRSLCYEYLVSNTGACGRWRLIASAAYETSFEVVMHFQLHQSRKIVAYPCKCFSIRLLKTKRRCIY